ncbi:hypothetical protein JAAARDRAFT_153620 [Jaapia argillacea MUCL 33604]|uniref:Postreplication repair E3 ubiquitin-protein ligase RAD18 n=1 Tax=Jaapia argillacea MUCL 33604 TaxID=933084 RepID=A0A067Q814_9AGAM|nr:hypothetical protein JAAARDRAFT_153620 [Jaapia argillacea MUCL 33604]
MLADSLTQLLLSDVPDPTDFPKSPPGLRELDSSLRCNICGDLFDGPVTLACGHCFCSLCVRNALAEKAECPICRKQASETQLRVNLAIETCVAAWKLARTHILRLTKEEEERLTRPKRKASDFERIVIESPMKKRKRAGGYDERNSSPTPGSSKSPSKIRPKSPVKAKRVVSQQDDDVIEISSSPVSNAPDIPSAADLVTCPVCEKEVPFALINKHIDQRCPPPPPSDNDASTSKDAQQTAWSKLMAGGGGKGRPKERGIDEEPIPKASYHTLKDKQLRELLLDHHLPVSGDRSTWITRHQRWVMLWNANLDKSPNLRKSANDLRSELKKWEAEKTGKKKTVVDDVAGYEKRNKAHFQALTEAARPRKVPDKSPSAVAPGSPDVASPLATPRDIILVDEVEEVQIG